MTHVGETVFLYGFQEATIVSFDSEGAIIRESDDGSEGWHLWQNLPRDRGPDTRLTPREIGAILYPTFQPAHATEIVEEQIANYLYERRSR